MAEVRNFSPEQEEEAINWYKENTPVLAYEHFSPEVKNGLYNAYFKLKILSIELRPNQFIIGIDYKDKQKVMEGTEQVNLSFWNPHNKGIADQFAKDILIAQLSKL